MQKRTLIALLITSLAATSTLSGCALFRATGETVEAAGEGAGYAVAETGRAVSRAADQTRRDMR